MKPEFREILSEVAHLFRPNPWHGVKTWADKSETDLNSYIEIVPTDRVKYEIDKETGYLKVDRPQKFSNRYKSFFKLVSKN